MSGYDSQVSHPSLDITGTSGDELSGRHILLALCGSVAVARAPELARLLMRHGARVTTVMSREARELIGPRLMHWSTGEKPVTSLGGETEHVALAGNTDTRADLLLIAPATANTIGKIAAGIDDTVVTTFATTAIGEGIPTVVVPAMHEPMYAHPIVRRNLDTLEGIGISVVMPREEEGKAKIADPATVLDRVIAALHAGDGGVERGELRGRHVIVTAGRTVEHIDPIRVLTNTSTGKMGMAVAAAAVAAGATVSVVYGHGTATPPAGVHVERVDSGEQMRSALWNALSATPTAIVVAAAAVGDWRPVRESKEKISTGSGRLTLELEPTPKIIDAVKADFPGSFLVAFRAQHNLGHEELMADARARAERARADLICVNDVSTPGAGFGTDTNEMFLLDSSGKETHVPMAEKRVVGQRIIARIAGLVGN